MIKLSFYFCILSLFSLYFSRSISFDFSQIEYAHKATKQGNSVIAMKRSNDIIVSIIKEIPHNDTVDNDLTCLHPSCHIINDDIYFFATGFIPDIEYIYEVASDLAFQHKSIFKTNIPIKRLVSMVAIEIHRSTLRKSSRPFAVNLLFLSNNTQTKNLEMIEIDTLGNINDCTMACLGKWSTNFFEKLSSSYINEYPLDISDKEMISLIMNKSTEILREDSDSNKQQIFLEYKFHKIFNNTISDIALI